MRVVRTRGRTASATYTTDKCVTLARVHRHAASAGWQRRNLILSGSMQALRGEQVELLCIHTVAIRFQMYD